MSQLAYTHDGREDGAMAMARDAAITHAMREGRSPEFFIRSHDWRQPTLTIGRTQALPAALLEESSRLGIALVRRPTGGGWLLHLPGDLSVSYVVAGPLGPGELRGAAAGLAEAIAGALGAAGRDARVQAAHPASKSSRAMVCFERLDREEVAVDDCKVAGIALARVSRSALVQSAVPLQTEDSALAGYVSRWDPQRTAAAATLAGLSGDQLAARIVGLLAQQLGHELLSWQWPDELISTSSSLCATHYANPAFTRGEDTR